MKCMWTSEITLRAYHPAQLSKEELYCCRRDSQTITRGASDQTRSQVTERRVLVKAEHPVGDTTRIADTRLVAVQLIVTLVKKMVVCSAQPVFQHIVLVITCYNVGFVTAFDQELFPSCGSASFDR